jgi:hypothetical protein
MQGQRRRQRLPHRAANYDAVPTLSPLYKTRLCRFFEVGVCRSGPLCSFAHGEEDLRPSPNFERTSMCPTILRDGVCSIPYCRYAHNSSDLRRSPVLLKTKLCSFALNGGCVVGSACRFAHGLDELREAAEVRQDALVAVSMAMAGGQKSSSAAGSAVAAPSRSAIWEARRASFLCNALPSGVGRAANNRSSSARRPRANDILQPPGTRLARNANTAPPPAPRLAQGGKSRLIHKNTFVTLTESDTEDIDESRARRRCRSL